MTHAAHAAVAIARPPTFDPHRVDVLDDAELDELSFGVLCLDAEGTILRYNAAEARLARLDRNTVIGRRFFGEVAPCTATPEFEGRFRALVEGRDPSPVVRFPYLFDFKFGAQEVEIEMVRAPGGRIYLLVNRKGFRPARSALPEGFAAPLHRELVEPEEDTGVARDTRAQREVHAPLLLFEALLRTCDRVAPETWPIFCREWGVQWGRRLVVELETRCLEETGQSLRERPMVEVAERIAERLRAEGWGELVFDLGRSDEGVAVLTLARSAIAQAARGGDVRRCDLVAGLLGAVLTHLAGRRLHVEEICCAAQGHARCEMVAVGQGRAEQIAEIATRTSELEAALAALGGPRG